MTKAKKTAKKQAKRGVKLTGDRVPMPLNMPVLAQAHHVVPFPDALKAFDDALEKVKEIRSVLYTIPGMQVHEEVKANRTRRLSDAASALQTAGWNLRESAYHEADK